MRTIRISIVPYIQTHCKGIRQMAGQAHGARGVGGEVVDSSRKRIDTRRAFDSQELFQGGHEVVIRHDGREYRLRLTRLGKLILTA